MNPVIQCQANILLALSKKPMQAHLFLESTHLPYDVQDLIFAAMDNVKKLDHEMLVDILEHYVSISSFDERLLH